MPDNHFTEVSHGNHLRWLRHRNERDEAADPDLTIGIAASFTAEPLEAQLGSTLLESGYAAPAIRFADYNQLHQVCLDPSSMFGSHLDHLVLLWRIEDVFERQFSRFLAGDDAAGPEIITGVAELASLVVGLVATSPAAHVVSTPPHPAGWDVDLLDGATSIRVGALHRAVVNVWLEVLSECPFLELVDFDALQRDAGASAVFDAQKWAMYRQPYRREFWALLGAQLATAISRSLVVPPKCIVLDCDNTLWGGVVGEDGIGGLELGDTFPGRAFQQFQRSLKVLKSRGVLLALVSKNNEADVLEVFERHQGMVLDAQDIVTWRINWEPKPENIESIADELNIGTDSLVFVDDSPAEIAEVAARVSGIRCLLVPEELADLPSLLTSSGLLRGLRPSGEDRSRTEMLRSEATRRTHAESMDRDDFLASLDLRVVIFAVSDESIGRVAQLTQKTNQFNLTTIRRTEAEVRQLVASNAFEVFAIRVEDRFGDYGIVGVAIVEVEDATWSIETLLMSCRVLGRGVETAFLSAIADAAVAYGASRLVGRYEANRKNAQVADFYANHGFEPVADTRAAFALDLGTYRPETPEHITLVS